MAFSGVLVISPPSVSLRRTGLRVNHTWVGQMLEGLQDPQYIQQLLKTVQSEEVVEGLSVEVVEKV